MLWKPPGISCSTTKSFHTKGNLKTPKSQYKHATKILYYITIADRDRPSVGVTTATLLVTVYRKANGTVFKVKSHIYFPSFSWLISGEKGRDLTQPYDRNPYTDRKIQKATCQHKERHQKLRLHNDCDTYIRFKLCSKLSLELPIAFDFDWHTFSRVTTLCPTNVLTVMGVLEYVFRNNHLVKM